MQMPDLQTLLAASAGRHRNHLCPRHVLGVRMGLYAAELFGVELPQSDKRIFTFVETDGCLIDGVAVSTGCWFGSRTMYLMDYGKTAATFVDTRTEQAIRVFPHPDSRTRALAYAPDAPDRWHAQLAAYQAMPAEELLSAQEVTLTFSLAALISKHGQRVVCERCGEDIINAREVRADGEVLCRACAVGAYYKLPDVLDLFGVPREYAGFACCEPE
jgi:formylmethanofuran dehydrogenase subunit E